MLALTRKPGQQIMIGDNILINIVDVQGDSVRIAIDAPKDIRIYRGELYKAIVEENKRAGVVPDNIDFNNIPKG
ncbi:MULTISPECIES: carbon storage regulator CsrA [Anaerosinus]|uniref:Translational regulator CsrA n=1 Tax=Selenobaculum gibii TaxID=3054208 RepID=A0A9Y2AGJ7_9FIRM|nr:carbon storage regulator CsrA [Selenobaculum gbiensis]WIW70404.1 carbon storage regulator CsrA [Selenobaculum gbiensis]